jgi:hypothetical protein
MAFPSVLPQDSGSIQNGPTPPADQHDPFFIPAGAEAYRRDNPNATVRFLDTGHFALETHFEEIAFAMRQLLVKSAG